MGIIEELENFEKQTLSQIVFNMCKWFDFDNVNINTERRENVESRIWISIKITRQDKTYYIDGQRMDIVRRRLTEWLKKDIEQRKK